MLSQNIGTLSNFNPKSQRGCFIQRIWAQQPAIVIYFAWQFPQVFLWSNKLVVKSISEYLTNLNSTFLGYYNSKLIVSSKYLNII